MMEQAPVNAEEVKPPTPAAAPSPALGTNVKGSGPADGFGLGRNGDGMVGGGGGGGRGGSRFGWYANAVIKAVTEALRKNPVTRDASFTVKVRIWADVAGRITRAKLAGSTGNLALDDAIRGGVLTGFQLPEAPPEGLPMPIVMRLTARRPN
jgi:TonB family protein